MKAKLDGGFHLRNGRRAYHDVVIASAWSTNAQVLHDRSRTQGLAAEEWVERKHGLYKPEKHPSATLWAFAVESLGCPSDEALLLLRSGRGF